MENKKVLLTSNPFQYFQPAFHVYLQYASFTILVHSVSLYLPWIKDTTWIITLSDIKYCLQFFVWQVIGGMVIVIMLPLVALTTQSASFVFTNFNVAPERTGISSKPYAVVLSFLVSQYSLYGYDAAAHLTEETKGADKNGPIAILSSIGIISVFGWAYILALTFSIQV